MLAEKLKASTNPASTIRTGGRGIQSTGQAEITSQEKCFNSVL
jgi:hypothetical protein